MGAYRLIVMDVDGTLVGADGHLAPGATSAVRAAEQAGVTVALSTGRTPPACSAFLENLGLAGPHIYFDGGLVTDWDGRVTVLERRAVPDALRDALRFAASANVAVELYTRDGYFTRSMTPEVEAHAALQGCAPIITELDGIVATGEVIKAEFVLSSPESVTAARAFADAVAGRLRLSWATAPGLPGITFVNIVAPSVSKGEAVRALAAHVGAPLGAVMAVGDSANDIPMFHVAGLAVAMGNAPKSVRDAAHVVTGDVDNGGLAEAIRRHALEDPSNLAAG